MLAGLCTVISQMTDIFITHHILMLFTAVLLGRAFFYFRIQIISVFVPDFQQPCHVVNTCNQFLPALQLILHIQPFQQLF